MAPSDSGVSTTVTTSPGAIPHWRRPAGPRRIPRSSERFDHSAYARPRGGLRRLFAEISDWPGALSVWSFAGSVAVGPSGPWGGRSPVAHRSDTHRATDAV